MSRALLDPFLQRLAWTLVHFLWQGAALGLSAWMVLTLLRRSRPQVRYGLSCLFLALCVMIPVITFLRMEEAPRLDPATLQTTTFRSLMALRGRLQPILPMILVAWTAGVGLFALRSLAAYVWLHRIRNRGQQLLEQRWQACVDALRKNRHIRRAVPLLESDRVRSPFTTGLLRPVILVPMGFFTSLDPLAAEAVLAHELAHIRRLDVLVIGLQTGIETLLFYHPAVWWISRRVATEREHCCDDDAVRACGDAVLFAHVLQRLDELREAPLTLAPHPQAGAGGGDLMERIKRLLAMEPGPVRLAAPGLSALVAITLCATTLAAQQEPVQQAVRQLVELGGKALHVAGQEAQGTQAALERFAPETPVTTQTTVSSPSENLGAEPLPLMPHHRLTEATLPTQPMELPPAPIHPAGAEQDAQILPVERLGFVLPAFADTPVDPWPDEMATLEAKSLPSYDDGVACLRSPLASAQSTRLLKLRIPGHSKLRVTAQGLSGKPKDAEFTVDYIHHQSLRVGTLDRHARKRWPQQVHYERGNADVIINPSEFPQSVMVVVSGPMRTPYRLGRFLEPVTEAQDPQISLPGYPLEPWPVSNAVLSASAPVACEGPLPRPEVAFDLQTALYPSDVGTGHYTWQAPNAGPVTHLRCLSLEVQPGERLAFKPWGTSQVLMEVVTPRGDEDAAWIQAVEKANKSGKFARSRGIKVHNPTGMPQQLVLVLYRLEEMKDDYRVNLERSPAR